MPTLSDIPRELVIAGLLWLGCAVALGVLVALFWPHDPDENDPDWRE